MTEQNLEYDQYAPQSGGRLFSNAMFGFNKEEVLEYLEELADENYQRQEAAEMQIQELNKSIQNHVAMGSAPGGLNPGALAELNSLRQQLQEATGSLDVAKTATQQSEDELQQFKEDLHNARQENSWLREEFQKNDNVIADLRRQLDSVSGGQWNEAQEEVAALRQQLEESLASANEVRQQLDEVQENETEMRRQLEEALAENEEWDGEYEGDSDLHRAASALIEEATLEADRIRADAYAEKDRVHRQIRNSTNGIAGSISNLREDITTVEGDVSNVLENMQLALSGVLGALGRTEQNINTFAVQVDRFPGVSPAVPPSAQQVVYFQPSPQQPVMRQQAVQPVASNAPANSAYTTTPRVSRPENTRSFRPSYSSTNQAVAPYWSATPVENAQPQNAQTPDERLRHLSESLVETLIQMMS